MLMHVLHRFVNFACLCTIFLHFQTREICKVHSIFFMQLGSCALQNVIHIILLCSTNIDDDQHFVFAFSVEVGENGGSLSLMTSEVWSDEKWLGSRAQFRPETFPAVLRVHDVGGSDAGQYRCRVDFREAPTRNTLVNLTVIG